MSQTLTPIEISDLPAAAAPLTGAELIPADQGASTVNVTAAQIAALASVNNQNIAPASVTLPEQGKVGTANAFIQYGAGGGEAFLRLLANTAIVSTDRLSLRGNAVLAFTSDPNAAQSAAGTGLSSPAPGVIAAGNGMPGDASGTFKGSGITLGPNNDQILNSGYGYLGIKSGYNGVGFLSATGAEIFRVDNSGNLTASGTVTTPTISSPGQLNLSGGAGGRVNAVTTILASDGIFVNNYVGENSGGWTLSNSALDLSASMPLRWHSGNVNTSLDTSLSRVAPSVLAAGNGTSGDASGTLQAATITATGGDLSLTGSSAGNLNLRSPGGIIQFYNFSAFYGGVNVYGSLTASGPIKPGSYTVATLPSPSSAGVGAVAYVTDSTLPYTGANVGAAVAGGGGNYVPVTCNSFGWYIG